MREIPKTYIAEDGTEFSSKEEAKAHEALVLALAKMEEAEVQATAALAQTQKTADGHLFSFRPYCYYHVREVYSRRPEVVEVRLSVYGARKMWIDSSNGIVANVWVEDNKIPRTYGYWQDFEFRNLYAERGRAYAACAEKARAWLAGVTDDVEDFVKRIKSGEIR